LSPNCSLYSGERGQPVGRYETPGAGNILKDHFIKCFRNGNSCYISLIITELNERYRLLAQTVLSVNNTLKLMDESIAEVNFTGL
jgi:hypothetical protein